MCVYSYIYIYIYTYIHTYIVDICSHMLRQPESMASAGPEAADDAFNCIGSCSVWSYASRVVAQDERAQALFAEALPEAGIRKALCGNHPNALTSSITCIIIFEAQRSQQPARDRTLD